MLRKRHTGSAITQSSRRDRGVIWLDRQDPEDQDTAINSCADPKIESTTISRCISLPYNNCALIVSRAFVMRETRTNAITPLNAITRSSPVRQVRSMTENAKCRPV